MNELKSWLGVGLLAAGLLITAATVSMPASAEAQSMSAASHRDNTGSRHDVEGTVVSINRTHRTFRLRSRRDGSIVKIKVNKSTTYKRLSGFGALYQGIPVDVESVRKNGRWIALRVQYEPD